MHTVKELRSRVDQLKGKREEVVDSIQNTKKRITAAKKRVMQHEQALEILRTVGLRTQQELEFHISEITSMALEAVFPDPYELSVDFIQRRNSTECDLTFVRDGNVAAPLDASGGGAIDVAAFALRVASWSMQNPRTRPVLVLDEPFRFLSSDLQPKASEMIKEVANKLGLQILIITHEENLLDSADTVLQTTIRKGKTTVTEGQLA